MKREGKRGQKEGKEGRDERTRKGVTREWKSKGKENRGRE